MTTEEKIEVMQAYADGKQIEVLHENDWCRVINPSWDWKSYDYRVKPEPKYRPYKDTDELIEDWKWRFNPNAYWPEHEVPLIWIWDKDEGEKMLVTGFRRQEVNTTDAIISMALLLKSYTYLDGSLCGKGENDGKE